MAYESRGEYQPDRGSGWSHGFGDGKDKGPKRPRMYSSHLTFTQPGQKKADT